MQQEASVAIAIRAKDEASRAFQGIQKNLTQTSQRIEGTRVSTQQGTSAFGMMKGMLLPLAGGLLSTAAAFNAIKTAIQETTTSAASAEYQAASMGPQYVKNLEEMRGHFVALGREFAYTSSEVETAFKVMQGESLRSDITMSDLVQTLQMARSSTTDLSKQAAINGQIMRGNTDTFRQNATAISEVGLASEHAAENWKGAITIFDRFGALLKEMPERIAHPSRIIEAWKSPTALGVPILGRGGGGSPGIPAEATGGTIVNLNIQGDLVATEEQRNQLVRQMTAAQDQINRGTR